MKRIAALFVQPRGCYFGRRGVELWDETRDARKYAGPFPVVAHPPCARWSRLAGLVEARWGLRRGDDGGCFESALASVRTYGGVLEHPAYSDAWAHFGLPEPYTEGGSQRGFCGGWSCYVEQRRYGHRARKGTWLYAFGLRELPTLRWGYTPENDAALVSWCRNKTRDDERPRVTKREASATPPAFRDQLVKLARSVELQGKAERDRTPREFGDVLVSLARAAS